MNRTAMGLVPFSSSSTAKAALAAVLAMLYSAAKWALGIYGGLFATDPALVVLLGTLLLIDWGTGVAASLGRGERISSGKLRRTMLKLLEYFAVVLAAVLTTGAFQHSAFAVVTNQLDDGVLLYYAVTELVSILENVTGDRLKAVRLVRALLRIDTAEPSTVTAAIEEAT